MAAKRARKSRATRKASRTVQDPNEGIVPSDPLWGFDPESWEAHGRVSQCLVSFGIGAGPIRISSAAALWLYKRLYKHFHKMSKHEHWRYYWLDPQDCAPGESYDELLPYYRNEAPQVLDLARSAGRYAAMLATGRGRFTIGAEEARAAMELFGKKPPGPAPLEWRLLGAYCNDDPPPPPLTPTRGKRGRQ